MKLMLSSALRNQSNQTAYEHDKQPTMRRRPHCRHALALRRFIHLPAPKRAAPMHAIAIHTDADAHMCLAAPYDVVVTDDIHRKHQKYMLPKMSEGERTFYIKRLGA